MSITREYLGVYGALSRRSFLKASCTVPVGGALFACGCAPHQVFSAEETQSEALTTLDKAIVPGEYLTKGKRYRQLAYDNGLPLIVREDLAPALDKRDANRKALVAFAQITDLHIIDASSPAHAAFMRQYGGPNGNLDGAPLANAWRPQETLTIQVLDAMIRRINQIGAGPISKRKFDFAISTGDSADTRAMHELLSVLTVLNGGSAIMSASGAAYIGVQDNNVFSEETYDAYWHPEPQTGNVKADIWKRAYGFPEVEGFLSSISQPINAEGFKMPWYSGFGNHDVLDYGVFGGGGLSEFISTISTSNRVLMGLPKGMQPEMFLGAVSKVLPGQMAQMMNEVPSVQIMPSEMRRPFSKMEFIQQHLDAKGPFGPNGHGFTQENVEQQNAYYQFQMADGVVGIMLDTTNPNGGPDGSLDVDQANWLENQLRNYSSSYYLEDGSLIRTDNRDALITIFSHHNSITFDNMKRAPAGMPDLERLGSAAFLALLARYPNVVLWVNGHTHCNRIWSHYDPLNNGHGFWEINTAAHIDYPQQSRTIEILDNRDGTLSIIAVVVDHSSPDAIKRSGPQTSQSLAALSLELAMNDPALDRAYRLGAPEDLNVELIIKKPFA
ncbi:TIGR03767 family metallophosphoesterase [Brucella pseudogrignonensis]|uniref:TIGR03767 family metallophosphoesterase n=1 Tax=Brucella pseudogrignonensis TaxID=419475 RepID=UPI003D958B65